MTRDELKRRYPNASQSFLKANADPGGTLSHPVPERHQAPALGTAVSGETQGDERITVRFIGYRVRPLDPDNFAGSVKDLLDGLRHANLISGDEPWRIILETEQVKVSSYKEERTEIQIVSGAPMIVE